MLLQARVASKLETRMWCVSTAHEPLREMTLASHVRERGSRRSGPRGYI
jgi:hypothetical protein